VLAKAIIENFLVYPEEFSESNRKEVCYG